MKAKPKVESLAKIGVYRSAVDTWIITAGGHGGR